MALMNQSAYAKHRKISKQTINRYLKYGYIHSALVFIPGKKKPLIDAIVADGILESFLDPRFTKKLKCRAKGESFLKSRAEAEMYRAKLLMQRLEEKKNKYILRSEVQKQISNASKIIREVLETIPARCAVTSEPNTKADQKEIEKILSAEIKPILKEFFKQLNEI
jgi:hypothetical protein